MFIFIEVEVFHRSVFPSPGTGREQKPSLSGGLGNTAIDYLLYEMAKYH